jgi:hypothetical protein
LSSQDVAGNDAPAGLELRAWGCSVRLASAIGWRAYSRAAGGATLPTLITVRQKYDLKNLFRYSQSIPVPA